MNMDTSLCPEHSIKRMACEIGSAIMHECMSILDHAKNGQFEMSL